MFKRLMRWLRGPKPTPTYQLREWLKSLQPIPEQVAVPMKMYVALAAHLEATRWFIVWWEYGNKMAGLLCDGVWVFPDPSVTEFTSR